jgi:hypothetical protein
MEDSSMKSPRKVWKIKQPHGTLKVISDTHTELIQDRRSIQTNGACKYGKKLMYKHRTLTNII